MPTGRGSFIATSSRRTFYWQRHHALVTDFGVAKALSEPGAPVVTHLRRAWHSARPTYMAPEQAAGGSAYAIIAPTSTRWASWGTRC